MVTVTEAWGAMTALKLLLQKRPTLISMNRDRRLEGGNSDERVEESADKLQSKYK